MERGCRRRWGFGTKLTALFVVIFLALLCANTAWSANVQYRQAEREMLETTQMLALEMDSVWNFMEVNQAQFKMNEDGTYNLYCVVAAKAVSKMFSKNSDCKIHYTNTVTRKDEDSPDEFENEALEAIKNDGAEYHYRLVTENDGSHTFRYAEPLHIEKSCLQCHGDPVGELDVMGYPKEGMKVGDVAGIASISMPADTYMGNIRKAVINQAAVFSLILLCGLLVLFAFVQRRIALPLGKMGDAVARIEQRDFESADFKGIGHDDEIADLADQLGRMAGELDRLYSHLESEVDRRTEQLEQANALLEDANRKLVEEGRYKTDFLAIMSHELRTPLTSILAFLDLWDSSYAPRDAKERKIVDETRLNGQTLLRLINNILETARLEAGRTELDIEPVDIADLVSDVRNATESLAEKRQITLTAKMERGIPVVYADYDKLRRILENLVSNAIKYTGKGGAVTIRASRPDGRGMVSLSVSDNGPGIAKESIPVLFDRFTQGSGTSARSGSGLGLAVVKELAELHGGYVEVESFLGSGSTFTVHMPVSEAPKEEILHEDSTCR